MKQQKHRKQQRKRINERTQKTLRTPALLSSDENNNDPIVDNTSKNSIQSTNTSQEIFTVVESTVMRMITVERASLQECADALNSTYVTTTWDQKRVADLLSRIRLKQQKNGQLEATFDDSYVRQDAKERYDAIIHDLRVELRGLGDNPMFAGARAKMLKTIADVEAMRDNVLQTISGKANANGVGAIVYISNLRQGPLAHQAIDAEPS